MYFFGRLYTQAEIVKMRGIAPSTLSGILQRYEKYIPVVKVGGKKFYPHVICEILDNIDCFSDDSTSENRELISRLEVIYVDYKKEQESRELRHSLEVSLRFVRYNLLKTNAKVLD